PARLVAVRQAAPSILRGCLLPDLDPVGAEARRRRHHDVLRRHVAGDAISSRLHRTGGLRALPRRVTGGADGIVMSAILFIQVAVRIVAGETGYAAFLVAGAQREGVPLHARLLT